MKAVNTIYLFYFHLFSLHNSKVECIGIGVMTIVEPPDTVIIRGTVINPSVIVSVVGREGNVPVISHIVIV